MRGFDNNTHAFLALLRAGLWETEVRLSSYGDIDYAAILQLAEEQSVVGLVTVGLEHVSDVKVPQEWVLQFIGSSLQIEQQNKEMNAFVAKLIELLRKNDVYALLVKGQGIAQCYERPLWRACGDVDLLLSENNYKKAKKHLLPLSTSSDNEFEYEKHLGMTIDTWVVELHGNLRSGLSGRVDKVLDDVMHRLFYGGEVRSWSNNQTQVFLPSANNDVIYVFTHFLNHFYRGGIGLRQICDWCRLLWTYRSLLNHALLESQIRKMGLLTEWRAFGALAVDYLGMSSEAMPLYSAEQKWKNKAESISAFILEVGNFGHNRDQSYFQKYPYVIRKTISLSWRVRDLCRHAWIFPMESLRFFPRLMFNGLKSAARGE